MKIVYLILAGLMFPAALLAQSTLTVTVSNIREQKGTLMLALHAGEDTFPNDKPYRTMTSEVNDPEVSVSFEDLPPGEYALSLYQDINENEELDKNILGIPREPFGFSNDAMGSFGAPSFKQCIIKVPDKEQVNTRVALKYM